MSEEDISIYVLIFLGTIVGGAGGWLLAILADEREQRRWK